MALHAIITIFCALTLLSPCGSNLTQLGRPGYEKRVESVNLGTLTQAWKGCRALWAKSAKMMGEPYWNRECIVTSDI